MSQSEESAPVPVIPPGKIGDRFVAAFMTVTLVLFAALAGMVIYLIIAQNSYNSRVSSQVSADVRASDHRWCTALGILTAAQVGPPADPAKNPSRVATYHQYVAYESLKQSFGCS